MYHISGEGNNTDIIYILSIFVISKLKLQHKGELVCVFSVFEPSPMTHKSS